MESLGVYFHGQASVKCSGRRKAAAAGFFSVAPAGACPESAEEDRFFLTQKSQLDWNDVRAYVAEIVRRWLSIELNSNGLHQSDVAPCLNDTARSLTFAARILRAGQGNPSRERQ
jgi:hypothetical protein